MTQLPTSDKVKGTPLFYTLILMLSLLSFNAANAQNLVANPSFEQIQGNINTRLSQGCAFGTEALFRADEWDSYNYSADLYFPSATGNIPGWGGTGFFDSFGPPQEGQLYAGIQAYRPYATPSTFDPDLYTTREFAGTRLSCPLVENVPYRVSGYFKKSPTNRFTINELGFRFDNNPTLSSGSSSGPNGTSQCGPGASAFSPAHVAAPELIGDSWTLVSDVFVADRSYSHLLVGVFAANGDVQFTDRDNNPSSSPAYYFVDNVAVEPLAAWVQNTNYDTTITINAGDTVALEAFGPGPYNWSASSGEVIPNERNPTVSPSATTTYTLSVDLGCIIVTTTLTVQVGICPNTVNAGTNVTINTGESTQLETLPTGGTPVSYSWSPTTGLDDASVADPVANPTVTTTYTVMADFGGGCTTTDQVTVTVVDNDSCRTELMNVIPNPSFETYNTCPDAQFQMDRVANWIPPSFGSTDYLNTCGFVGESFQPSPSFPIPDGNGFIGMYIGGKINPEYKESAGVCLNSNLVAGTFYELEFFVGFGTEATVAGARSPSPNTFVLYGTSDCNNIPYNQNSFEPCPFGNNPNFVELGRVEVSGNEGSWVKATIALVPPFDVEAIVLGGICAPIDSPTERYYFLDDFKLFQDTATGNTLDAGPDVTVNAGESTQLEALPTGGVPVGYSWTPATGLDDATIADPTASPAMTTTYTVTADFGGGCTATDQVTVTVVDPACPLMLSGGNVTEATCGLNDGSITGILVNGATGTEDYRWTDTNGTVVGTLLDLANVGLGSYTLTVTESAGCERTLTFAVNESGPPDLDDAALGLADTTCGGTTGSITGITYIGEEVGAVFRWSDSDGTTVGNALDLEGVAAGTYTLQVTDAMGCRAIAGPYTIGEPADCEEELPEQGPVRIANTMTPNGDGSNDMFHIEGIGAYPNSLLQIYNRWGNKIYERTGYSNDWYGTYQGTDLPVATYYYVLSLGDEAQTLYKGYITILR